MQKLQIVVLGLYFATFLSLVILLLVATQFGPTAQNSITAVAAEGLKIVLAALVGAMSATIGAKR